MEALKYADTKYQISNSNSLFIHFINTPVVKLPGEFHLLRIQEKILVDKVSIVAIIKPYHITRMVLQKGLYIRLVIFVRQKFSGAPGKKINRIVGIGINGIPGPEGQRVFLYK
jgi:hypothetical protein